MHPTDPAKRARYLRAKAELARLAQKPFLSTTELTRRGNLQRLVAEVEGKR